MPKKTFRIPTLLRLVVADVLGSGAIRHGSVAVEAELPGHQRFLVVAFGSVHLGR